VLKHTQSAFIFQTSVKGLASEILVWKQKNTPNVAMHPGCGVKEAYDGTRIKDFR